MTIKKQLEESVQQEDDSEA